MDETTPKAWVHSLPDEPPGKASLARIVELYHGRDDAENAYYESAADLDFERIETAQRRFRGRYFRRLRRIAQRDRHGDELNNPTPT